MNATVTDDPIDPPVCSPLVRVSLMVSDLDRSRRFYGELLGFTEEFASGVTRDAASTSLLSQPAGSLCRFAILKRPGPAFGMVSLFEASEPALPARPPSQPAVYVGDVFLTFYLRDLDPFVAQLEAAGGRLLVPPTVLVTNYRTHRQLVASDPDGVRINLMERDPSEAWRTDGIGSLY